MRTGSTLAVYEKTPAKQQGLQDQRLQLDEIPKTLETASGTLTMKYPEGRHLQSPSRTILPWTQTRKKVV